MLRKYDDNDLLAKMFLLFNALLHGTTGGYLLVANGIDCKRTPISEWHRYSHWTCGDAYSLR